MRRHQVPSHLRTGSEEQAITREIFGKAGGIVYCTSDPASRRVTKGIADKLIVFPGSGVLLAWDDKAGTEQYKPTDPRRLSKEQAAFLAHMQRGLRTEGAFGDAVAAIAWLTYGRITTKEGR